MALRTSLPVQPHLYIGDSTGRPLDYGMVYFGQPNKDPEFYPIDIYYDKDLSRAAAQPVRTKGGFLNANGDMTEIYASDYTYSVKVLDEHGVLVFYEPSMERVNISQDSQISTKLPYPEAIVRMQGDRNQDSVSAQDFGAIGNGIVDDTNAFANLEKHYTERNIDLQGKTYKVVNTPTANTYANGFFNIAGIIHPSELKANELNFKKHCMRFITGNRYSTGSESLIFGGSDNVFQSICLVPQDTGNPKLYVTQRAYRDDGQDQSNWLARETYRIIEYEFTEDGSAVVHNLFSNTLSIGHGSSLSYKYDDDGQLWFYSGIPSDSNTVINRSDKGFSRIKWRGAATSNADITYYQMFDYPEITDGIFPNNARAYTVLSEDKSLLGLLSLDNAAAHELFIYKLDDVLSASIPKNTPPIVRVKLNTDVYDALQGIAIVGDKVVLYYDAYADKSAIKIIDFNNNTLSEFEFDTYRSIYSKAELMGGKGVSSSTESEGLTILGNDLYVGYRDYWYSLTTVVSYNSKFYAPRLDSTGVIPTDVVYWQELTSNFGIAATEWSDTTTYTLPPESRIEVNKRIYKIGSVGDSNSTYIGKTNQTFSTTRKSYGVPNGGQVTYTSGVTSITETSGSRMPRVTTTWGETTLTSYGNNTPLKLKTDGSAAAITAYKNNIATFSLQGGNVNSNAILSSQNGSNLWLATYKDSSFTGSNNAQTILVLAGGRVTGKKFLTSLTADDTDLGESKAPFKDIYLSNAPIVSSDERLKQDFRSLKAAEKKAAIEIKSSICLYKMRASVEKKGGGARWHVGVKAQQIVSIMESHGLQPFDYGFICYDEWDAEPESLDDDGNVDVPAREAGDKYAIRYDELAMFILTAI